MGGLWNQLIVKGIKAVSYTHLYENIVREYPEHANDVEKKYQDERRTKKASSIACLLYTSRCV